MLGRRLACFPHVLHSALCCEQWFKHCRRWCKPRIGGSGRRLVGSKKVRLWLDTCRGGSKLFSNGSKPWRCRRLKTCLGGCMWLDTCSGGSKLFLQVQTFALQVAQNLSWWFQGWNAMLKISLWIVLWLVAQMLSTAAQNHYATMVPEPDQLVQNCICLCCFACGSLPCIAPQSVAQEL